MENFISWDIDFEIDDEGEEIEGSEYALISRVYVRPEDRGRGVARKMLGLEIESIKKEQPGLEIKLAAYPTEDSVDMDRLVSFYESMGFEEDSEATCDHAVIMAL